MDCQESVSDETNSSSPPSRDGKYATTAMGRGACLTWGAIAFVSLLISHAAPVDVSFELRGLTRTLTAMLSAIVAEERAQVDERFSADSRVLKAAGQG